MKCCDEGTCRQGRDHPPKYSMDMKMVVLMYLAAILIVLLLLFFPRS